MNIVFRVDASLEIGTGHVMRSLVLARALRSAGAKCTFICREHTGNMSNFVRLQGFKVLDLPLHETKSFVVDSGPALAHAGWLGCHWSTDAEQTNTILNDESFDWLITDHYALDSRWERALGLRYKKLLVIDDLADRTHACDVLLDQNLVDCMDQRYKGKVPDSCISLLGPKYALLRPEFNELRVSSLASRATPKFERLLVFLGGSDAENETAKVIEGIKIAKRKWKNIDVVVGQSFPKLDSLERTLNALPAAKLHVQTADMAKLMANADLAITAGGSVTWEKCVLGLPSLVVIQGDNQSPIATAMHKAGAQRTVGRGIELTPKDYAHVLNVIKLNDLSEMTQAAQTVCEGLGTTMILDAMGIAT